MSRLRPSLSSLRPRRAISRTASSPRRSISKRRSLLEQLEQRQLLDGGGLTEQWSPIGPTSTSVFAFERDPSVDTTVYAGTFFGGLYKSTDGSLSWDHLTSPFSTKTVFAVEVDPADSNNVFVGTFQDGLYRSSDGGVSWNRITAGLPADTIQDIAVDPNDSTNILATGPTGIFRSTNGGTDWSLVSTGLDIKGKSLLFDPRRIGVVLAGSLNDGIFRSSDAGASWSPFSTGLNDLLINSLDADDDSDDAIYATARTAIYRLSGNDTTWQDITYNLPSTTMNQIQPRPQNDALLVASDAGVFQINDPDSGQWDAWAAIPSRLLSNNTAGDFVHVISNDGQLLATLDEGVNPFFPTITGMQTLFAGSLATTSIADTSIVFTGTDRGLYYSSSAFSTDDSLPWPWLPGFGLDEGIFGVTPHPNDLGTLYAGTEFRGVWKTTDFGATWVQKSGGITPNLINAIAQSSLGDQPIYVGTGQAGLFVSRDDGASWERTALDSVTTPQITAVYTDPTEAGTAYFGTLQGSLFKTTNNGNSFSLVWQDLPGDAINDIARSPGGNLYAVTASGLAIVSQNGGNTWGFTATEISEPILTIVTDTADANVAFAGTAGGGVYKTTDAGTSWQLSSNGLAIPYVFALQAAPSNSQRLYAGTVGQVYVSNDSGQTWSGSGSGLPSGIVPNLAVSRTDPDVVFASVRDAGVFKSSDGGATWNPANVAEPFRGNLPLAISAVDSDTLFVGTDLEGIYRSDDSGSTFSASSSGMSLFVRTVAIDPSNPSVLYAGTFGGGVFKTVDGGESWQNVGLTDRNVFKVTIDPHDNQTIFVASTVGVARSTDGGQTWVDVGQRANFLFDIASDPTDTNTFYISSVNGATLPNGVIKTIDGGATWQRIDAGLPKVNIRAVTVDSTGRIYASAEATGIYRSDDGGATWQATDASLVGPATITTLSVNPFNDDIYAGSNAFGVFRSTDGGASWQASFGLTGEVSAVTVDPNDASRLYATTIATEPDAAVYVSTDGGQLWSPAATGLTSSVAHAIAASPHNAGVLFAATGDGVFKSVDSGAIWTAANSGLAGVDVRELFVDPMIADRVYAGTDADGMFVSIDGGQNWTAATMDRPGIDVVGFAGGGSSPLFAATAFNGVIRSSDNGLSWDGSVDQFLVDPIALFLALDPQTPGVVYATTSGSGVIKSTDGGNNWRLANSGLTNTFSLALAIDDIDPQTLYVGTAGDGVFVTEDGGDTWTAMNEGLYNTNITALTIDPVDSSVVYVGTEGGSVFAIDRDYQPPVDADGDGVLDGTDVDPANPDLAFPQLFFTDTDGDGDGDFNNPLFANSLVPASGQAVWGGDPDDTNQQVRADVTAQNGRVLGLDLLSLPESGQFYSQAIADLPIGAAPLQLTWQGLETTPGSFDGPQAGQLQTAADIYGNNDIGISLTISPLTSGFVTLPNDILSDIFASGGSFSDSAVIERFKDLLTHVHQQLSGVDVISLQIGHEIDRFAEVTLDGGFWQGYATFFQAAKAHAESLWGVSLPVATTWTSDGFVGDTLAPLRQLLDAPSDSVSVTFAPQADNYGFISPLLVSTLLSDIAGTAFPKPLYFQSVVAPSAPLTGSSTTTQAQFLQAFFDFWDVAANQIPFASLGSLHDVSRAEAEAVAAATFANVPPQFQEKLIRGLESRGLRKFADDGTNKSAYTTLQSLTAQRNWTNEDEVPTADTPWQSIGPDNALIFALERDPFDPGTMYAGTYFGGIYRSLDGGFDWEPLPGPFSQRVVFDIAADPQIPGTVYVATFQDGIYKTTDGGQNWTAASVGLTDLNVQDVEVDPFDSNHVMAATYAGVFRSTDGGASWNITNVGGSSIAAKTLAFDPQEQDIVYLGSFDSRGVLRSTNGGRNWSELNTGMLGNDVQKLRFDSATGQTLYATSSSGFVFKLSGETWQLINSGLPNGPVSDIISNPKNSDELFAATGLGVYKSTDGGKSWQPSYVAAGDDGLTISFRLSIGPNGNVIHAGNLNGDGLVSSFDGGLTWTPSFDGIQNLFVGALATVPVVDSALVYAGSDRGIALTGELLNGFENPIWFTATDFSQTIFEIEPDPSNPAHILAGTEQRGVYSSFDYGTTWQPSSAGILPRTTNEVAQSSLNPSTLLAGTSAGLWITRDGGANWAPTGALAIPSVTSIAQDPNRPGTFLFGTNLGEIYRSPDDGFSFILAQGGLPGAAIADVVYAANSVAYAITIDGALYSSADDGGSWTLIDSVGGLATTIEVNPLDGSLIYVGTTAGGVLRSTDGGTSWTAGTGDIANAQIFDIAIESTNPFVIYASGSGVVYKSTDAGTSWIAASAGLPALPVQALVIDSANDSRIWATVKDAGLYVSIDGGANWTFASAQLPGSGSVPIVQSQTDPTQLLAGPQHGGVYTSSDAGITWSQISNGISLFVRAVEFDPNNAAIVYAGSLNDGIFRSVDGGVTWTALGLQAQNTVFDLEIDPFDSNIIYVATAAGVVVSFDGGANFSTPLGPLFTTGTEGFVLSLEVDPTDATLYAATGGAGIWKSTDRGFNWTPTNNGITANQFLSLLIDPANPDTIYAGSVNGGVFVSEDGGDQWQTLNNGLFNKTITAIAIDPFNNDVIYVGTEGGGTFRNDRGFVSTVETVGAVTNVTIGDDAVDFELENGVIARVEFHADDIVRVRVNPTGALTTQLSGAIASDPEDIISTINDGPDQTTLETAALKVIVNKATFQVIVQRPDGTLISADIAGGIQYDSVSGQLSMQKEAPADRGYFGLGLRGGPLNRRGDVFENRNTDRGGYHEFDGPLYSTTPFYLGRDDQEFYGLFLDNPANPYIDLDSNSNGIVTVGAAVGELDYYIFAGPTANDVMQSYSQLTGFADLPALWTLGFQQSRYGYSSFDEIQQIADTFRDLQIPADAIYFDLDYMKDLDFLSWDPVNFPNPLANNQLLHELGFRTVNIVDPTLKPDDPLYTQVDTDGFFIKDAQGNTLVNAIFSPWDFVSWIDFSNPAAAQWYVDSLKQFLGTGVSAVWNDLNEPAQNNFPNAIHDYNGQQRTDLEARNIYALTEVALTQQAMLEANPDERPFILSRSGYPGIQRYAANWSGDTLTTFDSLRVSVQTSIHMATSGQIYFGHDIGGFFDSPSAELFTRWLEFASFTPFFRNHALNTTLASEPWQFGQPYTDLARQVINQRYELLPYVYTEAEEASRTGDPILEPVFFEFPGDENVYQLDDQFMWGDSMLVAPVYESGVTERTVYLPEGSRWFDWNTGLGYDPGLVTVEAPLGTIPVFVREASIIPTSVVRQHVAEQVDPRVILDIYPGDMPGEFVLYEDDGESFDYQSGEYLRTQISSTSTTAGRSTTIEPIEGNMDVPDRGFFLRFRNVLNDRNVVTQDGNEVLAVQSLSELETVSQGWYYDANELVLTVRVAGTANATTVDVQHLDLGAWLGLLQQQGYVPLDPNFPEDQWVAQGPDQAVVFAIEQNPFDSSHMLAGTFFGGLYESHDDGLTWQPVETPFAEKSVFDIEFDHQRDGVYFVATFEEGIYTTVDGGQTWLDADRGITDPNVQSIAVDPTNSANMLAATFSGVFRSDNGGLTWYLPAGGQGLASKDVVFDPLNASTVYMAALQAPGIYRSDDGGSTWSAFVDGMGQHDIQRLHYDSLVGDTLYAVSSSGDAYRLNAGTTVWDEIDDGLPQVPFNDIYVHPTDVNRLFLATEAGVYTSPDGGESWFQSYGSSTYVRQATLRLIVNEQSGRIHAGNLNGIGLVYSDDVGQSWQGAVEGFQNIFVGAFEVINTADSAILYAGSDQGLFYAAEALRTESGLQWIAPGGGDSLNLGIFTLKAHPSEPGTLFAGTERRGVYRSTDWGQTWEPWNAGIVPLQTHDIGQSRNDADVLIAGTSAGLWISRDGGQEWNETDLTIPSITAVLVDPFRNRTMYVGTDGGLVYRSTDDGDNFVLADGGLPGDQIDALEISSDGRLYAVTDLGDLFFSDDRGGSWSLIRQAGSNGAQAVTVDPLFANRVYLGTEGAGLLYSNDGGFSFTAADLVASDLTITDVVIDPSGNVYAGSIGAIFKSTDGGTTWTQLDSGLPDGRVYQIDIDLDNANHLWASIEDQGLYESTDAGQTWAVTTLAVELPPDGQVPILQNRGNTGQLFAGVRAGGVWSSLDQGTTWEASTDGISLFIRGLAIDPNDHDTMYAASLKDGIFKSTDGGETWMNTGLIGVLAFDIDVDPNDSDNVYLAGGSGVVRSTDGGVSWTGGTGPFVSGTNFALAILALEINPDDGTIFAATQSGAFRSTDAGATWQLVTDGLTASAFLSLAIDPVDPSTVYLGSVGKGVFVSEDGGDSWTRIVRGLFSQTITALKINPDDPNALYVGTEGGGVFSFDRSGAPLTPSDRPFHQGFTTLPPNFSEAALDITYQVIGAVGDLVAHNQQEGVPWLEALNSSNYQDYPAHLQNRWNTDLAKDLQFAPDHARYLMINPIETSYERLAPYWGEDVLQPLPAPFDSYSFDHPDVKQAYTNYLIAAVEFWDPTYLAIGIESNILLAKRPDLWDAYKELHQHAYETIKGLYPDLTVLTSIHYEHMLGLLIDSKNLAEQLRDTRPDILQEEVREILQFSDVVAVSSYPYMVAGLNLTDGYFDPILDIAKDLGKPLAFDQTAYISQDLYNPEFDITLPGNQALQNEYISYVLEQAQQNDFQFVVNFNAIDYGLNFGTEPAALTWAYAGLLEEDGTAKQALSAWYETYNLPYLAAPIDPTATIEHQFFFDVDGDQYGDTGGPISRLGAGLQPGEVIWANDPDDGDIFNIPTIAPRGERQIGVGFPATGIGDADWELRARELGAQVVSKVVTWSDVELDNGQMAGPALDELTAFNATHGGEFDLNLTLTPFIGDQLRVPSDLASAVSGRTLPWYNPAMVDRFEFVLDAVHEQLGDTNLASLQIGHGVDLYTSDPIELFEFAIFVGEISSYARYLWGDDLQVAVTLTHDALTGANSADVQPLVDASSFVSVIYNGVDEDYRAIQPTAAVAELGNLVAQYYQKEIQLQEVNYPSSPQANSSPYKQAQFMHALFDIWDDFPTVIPFVGLPTIYDLSSAAATDLVASLNDVDSQNIAAATAFIRSVGLWTDASDPDGDKAAYQSFRTLTLDRGWWEVEARTERSFLLGLTPFPYDHNPGGDLIDEVLDNMYTSVNADADLVVYHFDKGVPWLEALTDDFSTSDPPYSANLLEVWNDYRSRENPRTRVAVGINPLGIPRDVLAPYWGYGETYYHDENFNQVPTGEFLDYEDRVLPAPWDTYEINSPEIKSAFVNYAKRVIEFFDPEYLFTGIEVNLAAITDQPFFDKYVELQQHVYDSLRADSQYDDVKIIVSFTGEHFLRDEHGVPQLFDGVTDPNLIDTNLDALERLLPSLDVIGLSLYPQKTKHAGNSLPPQLFNGLFDAIRQRTDKPISITESGYSTESFTFQNQPYFTNTAKQERYVRLLMEELEKDGNVEFVTNFSVRDIVPHLNKLREGSLEDPPLASEQLLDVFQFFENIGLYEEDGTPKPGLQAWRDALALPIYDTVAVQPISIASPDGGVVATLDIIDGSGQLVFNSTRDGIANVVAAPIGIEVDGVDLGEGVTSLIVGSPVEFSETYPVYGSHSTAINHYFQYTVKLSRDGSAGDQQVDLLFRVFDDGLAYQWVIPGAGPRVISDEDAAFAFPNGSVVWHQQNTENYESDFRPQVLGAFDSTIGGPFTVELPFSQGYVLVTEAALRDYSGMSYRALSGTPFILTEFLDDDDWTVDAGSTSPWRSFIMAGDLNALTGSDLVFNLNEAPDPALFPNGLATDYIQPGKTVWSWWSDFVSGADINIQKQYVDYAHELGFEYSLIDIYWEDGFPADGKDQFERLQELVLYAKSDGRDVGLWVWKNWGELQDPFLRREWMIRVKLAGAVGIKVDNIDSADSESFENVQMMETILREAAEFELMVNFHGVPKPTGLARTFPNNITYEGFAASELNGVLWSQGLFITPLHNATLPFTRFAVGPGDYSPVIFDPLKVGATTFTHQLALGGILTSPMLVTADDPSNLLAQTDVLDILKGLPSVWDETIALSDSDIGNVVALARRSGQDWYLFAINGSSDATKFLDNVDLSFLGDGEYDATFVRDPSQFAFDRSEIPAVDANYELDIPLPAGGGFVAKFTPAAVAGRPFHLGFTSVPRTTDAEGFLLTYNMLQNGDLVTHSFQNGVPWAEAVYSSDMRDYSTALQERWDLIKGLDDALIPDSDVYLMLNPLRTSYDQLAPYWGSEEDLPVPAPFTAEGINSPFVKTAFTNYVIAAIDYWDPTYLAIGVEANIFLAKRPDLWEDYKELNAHVYNTVKSLYPDVTILTSVHYEHMLGLQEVSGDLQEQFSLIRPNLLEEEVISILEHSDAVAWSTYPYTSFGNVVHPAYYEKAVRLAEELGKPVAIDQTGYTSETFTIPGFGATYYGDEQLQDQFLTFLLNLAQQEDFLFVNNFVSVDYGENFGNGTNLTWAYTGLMDLDLELKQAFDTWSTFYNAPYTGDYPNTLSADSDGDGIRDDRDAAPADPFVSTNHLFYLDADGDGFGNSGVFQGLPSLFPPAGYSVLQGDQDDSNPAVGPLVLPKGDRVLGLEFVETAELGSFQDNLAYATGLGVEVSSLHLNWDWIEPQPQTYVDPNGDPNGAFPNLGFSAINNYYPANDLKLSLTLRPVNSSDVPVPSDLKGVAFDDPAFIDRFKTMLDFVFSSMPDVEIFSLQIGNEIDLKLDGDAAFFFQFGTFLSEIRAYVATPVDQGGAGYYGRDPFPIGTTATLFGLVHPEFAPLLTLINDSSDVINATYYPTADNFAQKDPYFMEADFDRLVELYPDKPIFFQETGYASATITQSSLLKQVQFINEFFRLWDKHADNIKYAQFLKLNDSSPQFADQLAASEPYLTVDPVLSGFLRTTGLRSYAAGGSSKPALDLFFFEAARRGFVGGMHNLTAPTDVNNDGETTAGDALRVINQIGIGESELILPGVTRRIMPDVNNDGRVTAVDALIIINSLGRGNVQSGGQQQQPVSSEQQLHPLLQPLKSDLVATGLPIDYLPQPTKRTTPTLDAGTDAADALPISGPRQSNPTPSPAATIDFISNPFDDGDFLAELQTQSVRGLQDQLTDILDDIWND